MRFPSLLTPAEEGGYVVTFPDVPEAITQGDTREEALANGLDALILSLDFYFEDRRVVPTPRQPKRGEEAVELPASVSAKVLLLNAMLDERLRATDLAARLGVSKQQVTRLLDLHHATQIDAVADALKATGRTLELQVSGARPSRKRTGPAASLGAARSKKRSMRNVRRSPPSAPRRSAA